MSALYWLAVILSVPVHVARWLAATVRRFRKWNLNDRQKYDYLDDPW